MRVFKCSKCGNMLFAVIHHCDGVTCCGEKMEILEAGVTDGALEKHVPAVSVEGKKIEVTVGEVIHPMLDAHYIQWIALETKKGIAVQKLELGQEPKAVFTVADDDEPVAAYEYCNLHVLWKKEI